MKRSEKAPAASAGADEIGAELEQAARPQREDLAVLVERELAVIDHLAAVVVGEHAFASASRPTSPGGAAGATPTAPARRRGKTPPLSPKPPPTSGETTRIWFSGTWKICDISMRAPCGFCEAV